MPALCDALGCVLLGANSDHTPVERMNIEGATFSEQLASFVDRILEPEGLEVRPQK